MIMTVRFDEKEITKIIEELDERTIKNTMRAVHEAVPYDKPENHKACERKITSIDFDKKVVYYDKIDLASQKLSGKGATFFREFAIYLYKCQAESREANRFRSLTGAIGMDYELKPEPKEDKKEKKK